VSTSDQRARDKDRDAAIEVVEAAWADGQIVEADRDRRVEELLRAQTLAEIRMHTHDLQLPGSTAGVVAQPTVSVSTTPNPYASATGYPTVEQLQAATANSRKAAVGCFGGLVVLVVVVAVVGVIIAAIVGISNKVDDAVDFGSGVSTETPLPGEAVEEGVNALSERGWNEFLSDLEEVRGSTESFEAVIYPTYVVTYLPVDGNSNRYGLWYWNGEMDDLDSRGTNSYQRFDLRDVDMKVVVRLVKRVRGMVEDPNSFYAIVRAPDPDDGEAISVYASNEYSESAFLLATLDGKVVYDSTKQ